MKVKPKNMKKFCGPYETLSVFYRAPRSPIQLKIGLIQYQEDAKIWTAYGT